MLGWRLLLLAQSALADIPFDLRTAAPAPDPGEIVVTGERDDKRRRIAALPAPPGPPRLSVDVGIGKAETDNVQGRMGDAQVTVKLKIPF